MCRTPSTGRPADGLKYSVNVDVRRPLSYTLFHGHLHMPTARSLQVREPVLPEGR